jgi:hypothetical protein
MFLDGRHTAPVTFGAGFGHKEPQSPVHLDQTLSTVEKLVKSAAPDRPTPGLEASTTMPPANDSCRRTME